MSGGSGNKYHLSILQGYILYILEDLLSWAISISSFKKIIGTIYGIYLYMSDSVGMLW